jgi:cytochrome c biogenesis protein
MAEISHKSPVRMPLPRRTWQLLSSPRLTLVLILILVALCLVGVFLIQAPSEVTADPASYRLWVQNMARPRLGVWADIFSFLRLLDVFHSPWFLAVGGLLMVSILFCTVNRWTGVMNLVRGGDVKQAASFYRTGNHKAESVISASSGKVGLVVTDILKKRRYRVRTEKSGEAVNLAAQKNRFSPAGTFLTHLSLILFVLGFLVTAFWGFRHASFIVPEGSKADVGHGTGLSLELISFEDEYWPDGRPKDFRSYVALYSGEQEVAQAVVRVNSPLSYRGINFYQASFGLAARIQIRQGEAALYDGNVPLAYTFESESLLRYAGEFALPEAGITVRLVSAAFNGADPIIGENALAVLVYRQGISDPVAFEVLEAGVPRQFEDLQFTFVSLGQFSVFQVTHNPGITVVWIACAFLILGLSLVFYLPYRQLWVLIEPKEGEKSQLLVRAAGRSSPGLDDIDVLVQQVKRKL